MLPSDAEISGELSQSLLILDASFMLDEEFPHFLEIFRPIFEKNPPLLLDRVEMEVERLAAMSEKAESAAEASPPENRTENKLKNQKRPAKERSTSEEIAETVQSARKVKQLLADLTPRGSVRRVQTSGRAHGAAAILAYVLEERIHHDVCVLTNERNLTSDLYALTRQKSINSPYSLSAAGFRNGKFGIWEDPEDGQAGWFSAFLNLKSASNSQPLSESAANAPIPILPNRRQKNQSSKSRCWKWWGILCTLAMLVLPVLFVRWFGLENWSQPAFWLSVALTLFFLHFVTFLMVVLVPTILSWLIARLFGIPVHWTLPTLMILGGWLCFRFAGQHGELLRPGGKKCVFSILYRQIFH